MRKSYVILVLVLFFSFLNIFNAEENVDLTCKYKNPFGGKDLTIVFTNYENDYKISNTGKIKKGAYFKVQGSSFSEIVISTWVGYNGVSSPFSINVNNVMNFDNKRWILGTVGSSTAITNKDGTFSCPKLAYSDYARLENDGPEKGVTILHFAEDGYCESNACKSIKSLTTTVYDPNKPDKKEVSTCYFNVNQNDIKLNFFINSYTDGSLTYTVNGKTYPLDMNSALPIYAQYKSGDSYTEKWIYMSGENFREAVKMDSNNKLTCLSNLVPCIYGTNLYLAPTHDKLPDIGSCRNNMGSTEIDKEVSDNVDIIDNSDIFKPADVGSKIGFCEDYLGLAETEGTIANLLDKVFFIVKVGSIILVIVLSMLEFANSTVKNKDELMVSVKKLVNRLIVLLILLMLPTFIDILGNIIGKENILCGIK